MLTSTCVFRGRPSETDLGTLFSHVLSFCFVFLTMEDWEGQPLAVPVSLSAGKRPIWEIRLDLRRNLPAVGIEMLEGITVSLPIHVGGVTSLE